MSVQAKWPDGTPAIPVLLECKCGSEVVLYHDGSVMQTITVVCNCGESITWTNP